MLLAIPQRVLARKLFSSLQRMLQPALVWLGFGMYGVGYRGLPHPPAMILFCMNVATGIFLRLCLVVLFSSFARPSMVSRMLLPSACTLPVAWDLGYFLRCAHLSGDDLYNAPLASGEQKTSRASRLDIRCCYATLRILSIAASAPGGRETAGRG